LIKAHAYGAAVLIDGAQAVPLQYAGVGCDFYVFQDIKYVANGHRILYGKESWLNKLPAYQGGGEMIKDVSFENYLCWTAP
jgi:cysteine desulfurase/selenocysteine lyase